MADAFGSPPVGEADDEQAGVACRLEDAVLTWRDEHRLGDDSHHLLHEHARRATAACSRRAVRPPGRPRFRAAGASSRATARATRPPRSQTSRARHLRRASRSARSPARRFRRARQHRRARARGRPRGPGPDGHSRSAPGRVDEHDVDVVLGGELRGLRAGLARRVGGDPRRNAAFVRARPGVRRARRSRRPTRRRRAGGGPGSARARAVDASGSAMARRSSSRCALVATTMIARLPRYRRGLAVAASSGSCRRIACSSSCRARARLDPELVDEAAAASRGRPRAPRPGGRPVERPHQRPRAARSRSGCSRTSACELADELRVAAEREIGLEPPLERVQAQLLESEDLRLATARERRRRAAGRARARARRAAVAHAASGVAVAPLPRAARSGSRSSSSRADADDVARLAASRSRRAERMPCGAGRRASAARWRRSPGGSAPQSSSISRSAETTSFARVSRSASSVRCLTPPSGSTRPCSTTSSGPRMRNSTFSPSLRSAATLTPPSSAGAQRPLSTGAEVSRGRSSSVGFSQRTDGWRDRSDGDPDRLRVRRLPHRRPDRPRRDGRRLSRLRPAAETHGRAQADRARAGASITASASASRARRSSRCRSSTRTSCRSTTRATVDGRLYLAMRLRRGNRPASAPATRRGARPGPRARDLRPGRARARRRARAGSSTAT